MTRPYRNADEVLPPKLVREIQRFHTGLLYVPSTELAADKRRVMTLNLAMKGCTTVEIAEMLRISPRRVRQILAEERKLTTIAGSPDMH
jgi:hypothetical protein